MTRKDTWLTTGLLACACGWAALLVWMLVRGREDWFAVFYNLPISVLFFGFCGYEAGVAGELGAKGFLKKH